MFLRMTGILCLLSVPAVIGANLITNGGFESGNLTGWTTTVGSPTVQCGNAAYAAHSGNCAVRIGYLGSVDGLSQVSMTVPATCCTSGFMLYGASYSLDFWVELTDGAPGGAGFSVYWNGLVYGGGGPNQMSFPYSHVILPGLQTIGTSATLTFYGDSTTDRAFMIDDINLVANPIAPEPNTIGLLLGGLVVLVIARQRRSARVR